MEKLDYLINYLLEESGRSDKIPTDIIQKKKLYRALVNIRMPKEIDKKYLEIENEYLKEELEKEEIIDVNSLIPISKKYPNTEILNKDKICIFQGDMTLLDCDAIVNPANSQGLGCFVALHNCLDNQIGSKAGVSLRLECNEKMKEKNYNLETGHAFITDGYNLKAKKIIHTVGPIIKFEVTEDDKEKLANCYINSLNIAIENNVRTIAFPCISTGLFRFPKDIASKIAISVVDEFLSKNRDKFDKVVFSLYSDEDVKIYEQNIR